MAARSHPASLKSATRYQDDLYGWVQEQVALLRDGCLAGIDAENVAEELSDVAWLQKDRLEEAITVLTHHLLKWDRRPKRRTRSWGLKIRSQRRAISRLLARNPGLQPHLSAAIEIGYGYGRRRALGDLDLPDGALPEICPYSFDEMMGREIAVETVRRRR